LLRFHYENGDTAIKSQPIKVLDLPGGTLNHHWTKNVIASKDGSKLYVTVGSNSNVAENGLDKEEGRAAIWEVDRATGNHRIFASGLRNPNGLSWEPQSGALWTAVNERDEIGSDLVPDYITSVKDGAFYGWPFSYYGQHVDVRVEPQNPDMVAKAIAPDYAVGPHTAGTDVRRRQPVAGAIHPGRLRWPARLMEPQAAQWLQSDIRAVRRRQTKRAAGGCAHGFSQ
jgi:glucose/arabinose dehydrogenase